MLLSRLSGRKLCERVKSKGYLWKGKHMHVRSMRVLPRAGEDVIKTGLFVGVVTSAKLHKSAVTRNRMRRRCREALRLIAKDIQTAPTPAVQLLLFPRSSSLSAPFEELQADARRFLSSLRT